MVDTLRVLYVDDEPGLLEIAKLFLEKEGAFAVDTLTSAMVALEQLDRERYDAIISDYQMPEMDGIQFLIEVRTRFGPIPFILFTGRGREEVVIQAINSGADFYLQKGGEPASQFAELEHKIRQATSRKRADAALRKSEEKYRHLIDHSNEAIVVAQDGMLKLVNHRAVEFTGYSEQELLSMSFSACIHPDDRAMVLERYQKRLKGEALPSRYRFRLSKKDGNTRWVEIGVVLIEWEERPATLNFLTDITERKVADDALSIQHDLSLVLNKCTRLDEAFNQILSAALKIEGLDAGGFYIADPATGALDIVAHQWLSPEFIAHTSHFDANSPQVQRARTGIPFYGQYSEIRPPGKDEIRDMEHVTALASLPVMHEGELISILNLASHTTDEIPQSTRHTLETMAMQVSSALVRIRSRKALVESEERYRHVVEDQTEFICRFLPDGTHVFVNEAYCRYFGLDRAEIIGTRFRPVIHPEDSERVARLIASLTPDHQVEIIDQRIVMPDDSIRWQRWVDRAIFHADGSLKEYQSVGRDITEHKRAEEALRESEEQLHLAVDSADLGLWDMNLLTGEAVHNQRWADMLGFSMDELEKPSEWWGQRVHPDDYQDVLKLSGLHRAGKTPFFEAVYRMKHKNGEWRWVHSQGKVISWDNTGTPCRMIGINQDITERKSAEEALFKKAEELHAAYEELTASQEELRNNINEMARAEQALGESGERLNFAIESAHLGLWDLNIITHEIVHNQQWTEMLGFSSDEMDKPSSWWQERVHPDDLASVTKSNADHLSGNSPSFDCIYRMKHQNGEWRWIHSQGKTASRDSTGVPLRMIGINQDITERKRSEEALLKNAEELYAANEELTASDEELRQTLDNLGKSEEAVKESERVLSEIVMGSPIPQFVIDRNHRILHWNRALEEYSGISANEVAGTTQHWRAFYPKERSCLADLLVDGEIEKIMQVYSGKSTKSRFIDGAYEATDYFPKIRGGTWLYFTAALIRDMNGAVIGAVETLEDITERKVAERDLLKTNEELSASYEQISAIEEELRQNLDEIISGQDLLKESEEKYRTVFENTGTATVVIEESGIISLANEEFARLSSFPKDDIEGKKSWTEFVVKEDLERMHVQHQLRRQNNEEALTHYEFRFVRKSKDIRVIYLSVGIIPGTKISVASLLDITDRKRAEELYQTVFENTGTAMIILDEDTTISHVNDEMEKIWGYSREEIEGQVKWPKLVATEDLEKMLAYHRLRRTDPGSAPRNYEFRFVHKDGGLRDAALTASMIPGTKKSVISLRDITEFKKTELALRQANKKLNLLSGITRHDIINQLTMLQGYLEILKDTQLDSSQNEYCQKVTTAAERISAMILVTKEYEQIGIQAPTWQECHTLVDTAAKQAPLGKVVVTNDLPIGAEVFADPLIVKVCYNLMDNAVRYGGKITTIRFSAEEAGDEHVIICEDDGDGIIVEEKEKIFERGFGKNTGLGLALSREILAITGITIKETGEPGKGARFEIVVPKGMLRMADERT